MKLLEIAADRHGFTDAGAVFEFEHGHHGMGVLGNIRGFELQIIAPYFLEWNLNAFLGQINMQPPWVRGNVPVVDFHSILISLN